MRPPSFKSFPLTLLTKEKIYSWFTREVGEKKRIILIGLLLVFGTLLVLMGYQFLYQLEAHKIEKNFITDANIYARDIEKELNYDVDVVFSLQSFFKASGTPSREAFTTFTNQLLENHKTIKLLSWLPRVEQAQREDYIREARKFFPDFQIFDLDQEEAKAPSPPRSVYYPIYYIEPYKGNEIALGFDNFSNEKRRKLLELARDTGESLSTEPIRLVGKKENNRGFLIYAPIYRAEISSLTIQERRQNILGFVLGTFKFQELINSLNTDEAKDLNVTLFGSDPLAGERFLYSTHEDLKEKRKPSGLSHEHQIRVAEEKWTLVFTPKSGQYLVKIDWPGWGLLGVVTVLIFLTAIYLWSILRSFEESQKLTSKFTNLFESTPYAKMLIDNQNLIVLMNQQAEHLFGYSRSELMYHPYTSLLAKSSQKEISKVHASKKMERKKQKLFILQKNGIEVPVEFEISPLIQGNKEVLFVCTFTDLSHIETLEKDLERVAHYDPLTKLPNQQYFEEVLRKKLTTSKKSNQLFYLFLISLDQFKDLNTSLGQEVGNAVLQAVATRIRELDHSGDFVARSGGDEFILLTTKIKNLDDVRLRAQKILQLFVPPLRIDQHEIKMNVSIGISYGPEDEEDVADLIKKATVTMYHVKKKGGNNFEIFHPGLDVTYRYKFELESALDFALERKELYLEYQPIVEIPSQRMIGVESLLRWKHPKFGLISPLEFIPFIEHKPLMIDIGEWIFKTAAFQSKVWNREFKRLYMSINISPRQLQDKDHLRSLARFCEEENISPKTIVLEITESTIMHGHKKNEALLNELAKKGFSFSIDDFGTKYSSLERLSTLPISYLKIDKSFIDGIGKKKSTEQIIKSIIALAHNLNLKVIAEGVETKDQLDFLIAHKCFYVQGFYLSKPLSPRRISTLLRKQRLI